MGCVRFRHGDAVKAALQGGPTYQGIKIGPVVGGALAGFLDAASREGNEFVNSVDDYGGSNADGGRSLECADGRGSGRARAKLTPIPVSRAIIRRLPSPQCRLRCGGAQGKALPAGVFLGERASFKAASQLRSVMTPQLGWGARFENGSKLHAPVPYSTNAKHKNSKEESSWVYCW